jgi:hypothetical protein
MHIVITHALQLTAGVRVLSICDQKTTKICGTYTTSFRRSVSVFRLANRFRPSRDQGDQVRAPAIRSVHAECLTHYMLDEFRSGGL